MTRFAILALAAVVPGCVLPSVDSSESTEAGGTSSPAVYVGPVGPTRVLLRAKNTAYNETYDLSYTLDGAGRPTAVAVQSINGRGDRNNFTLSLRYRSGAPRACAPHPPVLGTGLFDSLFQLGIVACPESVDGATTYSYADGRMTGAVWDAGMYGTRNLTLHHDGVGVARLDVADAWGRASFRYAVDERTIHVEGQYSPANMSAVPVTYKGTVELGTDGRRLREVVTTSSTGNASYVVEYEYAK